MKIHFFTLIISLLAFSMAAQTRSAQSPKIKQSEPPKIKEFDDENPPYGSKVGFTVDRYHLDDKARPEYERLHPPANTISDLNARLLNLKFAFKRYKEWVKATDEIIRQIIFAGVPLSKAVAIDNAFDPVEKAVDKNLTSVSTLISQYGGSLPATPVDPELLVACHKLTSDLEALHLGNSPEDLVNSIMTTITQLQKNPIGLTLQQRLQNATAAIGAISADEKIAASAKSLVDDIETFAKNPPKGEIKIKNDVYQNAQFAKASKDATDALTEVGGDLLARRYTVYQDLSDPFIDYISRHPEGWNRIANRGLVAGDGDTQFIIVFENNLDGRFNFVSVDPTKVIQARMRIGRKVAEGLVSLAGVAAKPFGVPIPASIASTQSQTNSQTIDFSEMTAAETQMRLQNDNDQRNLEALRKYALDSLVNFPNDALKADAVRQDLIRRLQPYIKQ